ncbi:MAG: S24 family peptidase [Acidithiobacillus sp.]|nr:S24 family peptidase [Acidithiobacillus sp.]
MKSNKDIRAENLDRLIQKVSGGSARLFAERIDKAASLVSRWRAGNKNQKEISSETAREIESVLRDEFDIPVNWMDQDHDILERRLVLAEGPDIKGLVPLISTVQAGQWTEIVEHFQPGDAEEWLPCMKTHGPRTFALRVKGDSMFNPGGKWSIAEGEIVYVDPERAPENRQIVVVRLDDERQATLKQYVMDGDKPFLKALNPQWPTPIIPLDRNATLAGVVIGVWRDAPGILSF